MSKHTFQGFSPACPRFFHELAEHNDKAWFDDHKADYEDHVLTPSRQLVTAMGRRLEAVAPEIVADPRVNRSLFRINRDTRFSKDKRPYKTHLGILWWEGPGKRMTMSGFYFQLEPKGLLLAGGMHTFDKPTLEAYREAVVDEERGGALDDILRDLATRGDLSLGGSHYKRVPRGYDKDHPRAALLKHAGLYAFVETPLPPELDSSALVDYCFERYAPMAPLHRWLVELTHDVAVSSVGG